MATTSGRSGHPFQVDENDVEDIEGLHVRKRKTWYTLKLGIEVK